MNGVGPVNNFANAISPFSPVGKQAVGEENTESKASTFKPVLESPESNKSDNRTEKDDPNKLMDRANRPIEEEKGEQESGSGAREENREEADADAAESKKRRQDIDVQNQIRDLAARDREVRNHERAHSALGGVYAGAPTYTYKRGPDGVNYAVSGEVSISSGRISEDPRANIQQAQAIRRAALAPSDPSPQDRRVAASAAQMEADARQALVEKAQQERLADSEQRMERQDQLREAQEQKEERVSELAQEAQQREEVFSAVRARNLDLNQRLIDIGVQDSSADSGSMVSESV
ncbi:putative metalloprotease CJM1_0395 family protein [Aurantivibrio plasticivorans]